MEEVDISIYAPACLAGKSETFTGVHAWTYGKFLYETLEVIFSSTLLYQKDGEMELPLEF